MQETNMDFQPGDIVKMKSGGPLMTVQEISDSSTTGEIGVFCVWFEKVGNKQICQRETFAPVLLEKGQKPGLGIVGIRRS